MHTKPERPIAAPTATDGGNDQSFDAASYSLGIIIMEGDQSV